MKATVFIPTHVLIVQGETKEDYWEQVNKDGENWLEDLFWTCLVFNIIKISEGLILVIWYESDPNNGNNIYTLYKGVLK